MAFRRIESGAVIVHHHTEHMRLLDGDTEIEDGAIVISIPNKSSHSQRMDYLKRAYEIKHGKPYNPSDREDDNRLADVSGGSESTPTDGND